MLLTLFLRRLAIVALMTAGACAGGDEDPPVTSGLDDEEDASAQQCRQGAERSCDCDEGTGVSVCSGGHYGECRCRPSDEGRPSADNAGLPKPHDQKPLCKAGYYAGNFSGLYRPGIVGLGIIDVPIEVEVAGATLDMNPALTLTLEEEAEGAGEFVSVTVGNGCMAGLAEAGGSQTPFAARITGSLDCRTGKFDGLLRGFYTFVGIPGLEFEFTGPFRGQFDDATTSLEQGTWMIEEPEALLTGAPAGGGQGMWQAAFVSVTAPDAGADPCESVPPAPTSDAVVR